MGRNKTIDDAELIRIARDVFREHGHTAATRDVARAAGISQAVLYQRFGSKEDLFLRAMTPESPDIDTLLGPYPPRNAKTDLKRIAERLTDFFATFTPTLLHVLAHPDLGARGLKKWHANLPFIPIVHALADRFRKLRSDGLIGAVDPEAAAHTMIASMHTVAMLKTVFDEGHGHHHGKQVEALVDVMWSGLAPRDGEQ
jgi:AcrR family transcriptional regulator